MATNYRFGVKAIQMLYEERGHRVPSPADVVDAARRAGSPLSPFFTWDDYQAAESWRRRQAWALLDQLIIEVPPPAATSNDAPSARKED
jgi:hypothetical protein